MGRRRSRGWEEPEDFWGDDFWGDEGKAGYSPSVAVPEEKKHLINGRQFHMPTHDDSGNPLTKTAQATIKRGARARSDAAVTGARTKRRKGWEASEEGKSRLMGAVDHATAAHNEAAANQRPGGAQLQHIERTSMTHQQIYAARGYHQESTPSGAGTRHLPEVQRAMKDKDGKVTGGTRAVPGMDLGTRPGMHDQQIPGLEDPDALPVSKRWEDHTAKEQQRVLKAVKKKTGATPVTMGRDFGAQLDQSYDRSRQHGADLPAATTFYSSGAPAQKLHEQAKRLGVRFGLVAATNADTSPNMKFQHTYRDDHPTRPGETVYPNADAAEHAIKHAQSNPFPYSVSKDGLEGSGRGVRPANLMKAARRAHQVLREGKTVGETFASTSGGSGFGPKTAAYHNSWLGGTPKTFVADLHSGGGGMLAHLGTAKPFMRDNEGQVMHSSEGVPRKEKSEREKGIETTGFHALSDHVARTEMAKRGLGHIEQAQASQWGEEQIHRHEQGTRAVTGQLDNSKRPKMMRVDAKDAPRFNSAEKAYAPHPQTETGLNSNQFHQGTLF